jgi:hypothetical protein
MTILVVSALANSCTGILLQLIYCCPLLFLLHDRMFPEFEETVTLELDFVQEGTNCERVAR